MGISLLMYSLHPYVNKINVNEIVNEASHRPPTQTIDRKLINQSTCYKMAKRQVLPVKSTKSFQLLGSQHEAISLEEQLTQQLELITRNADAHR